MDVRTATEREMAVVTMLERSKYMEPAVWERSMIKEPAVWERNMVKEQAVWERNMTKELASLGEEHGQGAGSVGDKKSVKGKRNLSLLLREKREQLRQMRTNKFRRCDRVSSKDVSQEWVQDKSKVMVVIGSDAVTLYPIITKQESSNEVADAVMEGSLKWEGVNWKEATRYLALGRDEAWYRSSDLYRVLPWRKHKQGSRPGLTELGPMGLPQNASSFLGSKCMISQPSSL